MKKQIEKIKKCPFCGRIPKIVEVMDYIGPNINKNKSPEVPHYFVCCHKGRDHSMQVGASKRKTAVARWNKRVK